MLKISVMFAVLAWSAAALPAQELYFVEGDAGVFRVVRQTLGGMPVVLYTNTTGMEGLSVAPDGTVYLLEESATGGTDVVRVSASGTATTLHSSAAGVEYGSLVHHMGVLVFSDDNGDLYRITANAPTLTAAPFASPGFEIDAIEVAEDGTLWTVGCTPAGMAIFGVHQSGMTQPLFLTANNEYKHVAVACNRLQVLEEDDTTGELWLRRAQDPSDGNVVLEPPHFIDPTDELDETVALCDGSVLGLFEDWQGMGRSAIVRIDLNGQTTVWVQAAPGVDLQDLAVIESDQFRLRTYTEGNFDLSIGLHAIPSATTQGALLYSFDTSGNIGQGALLGLRQDATVTSLLNSYAGPVVGGPVFWAWPVAGVFPDTAFSLPPQSLAALAFTRTDLVGIALTTNGLEATNVLRLTW